MHIILHNVLLQSEPQISHGVKFSDLTDFFGIYFSHEGIPVPFPLSITLSEDRFIIWDLNWQSGHHRHVLRFRELMRYRRCDIWDYPVQGYLNGCRGPAHMKRRKRRRRGR